MATGNQQHSGAGSRNLVLQLEYDGTAFVGSQLQAKGRTVQGELEAAWQRFCGEQRRCHFAGRTDAGVHAQGQVANVHTETDHSVTTVQRALNALLPGDVTIQQAWDAEPEFHARFSAVRRDYRYTILGRPYPSALLRRTAWHIGAPLDVAAMAQAALTLTGEHDFATFGTVDRGSTVRRCSAATCRSTTRDGYPLVVIELSANGFLRHMVRAITATLVEVGRGKRTPDEFRTILKRADRSAALAMAPPHGLCLVHVAYAETDIRE
ncbi:MAG: tRNA pseudouridine(38-40) synthase TruA [Herpetosiphon sp.]